MLPEVDQLLRGEGRYALGRHAVPLSHILCTLGAAGWIYGVLMGSYAGEGLQMLHSGLKVPFLLLAASLLCLPSFFVLNTLLGLRSDFAAALRGIFAAQATLAVCLASLGPLTLFAYVSDIGYPAAKLLSGACFAIASYGGQLTLGRHYRPLIARNARHRLGLVAWLVLYVFVAIQLAWILRPFVGAPGLPVQFFREDAWGNAYLEIARTILAALSG
jgi:hypothetical protein